jgi:hypothetical protein
MTAGAMSMKPSLRSARAPSDSSGLPFFAAWAGVGLVVTAGVVVLIGPSFGSRDQSLGR